MNRKFMVQPACSRSGPVRCGNSVEGLLLIAIGAAVVPIATPVEALAQNQAGLVIESDAAAAYFPSPIRIEAEPMFDVGAASGDPARIFTDVAGARVTSAGTVLVVDRATADVRMFGVSGDLLRRVGRRGEGPGEFLQPSLLNAATGDSVFIHDGMLRRLTSYANDGSGFRVVEARAGGPGRAMAAADGKIVMLTPDSGLPRDARGPSHSRMMVRLVDLDPQGGSRTLTSAPYVQVPVAAGPIPTFVTAPFVVVPSVAAGPEGFFVASVGEPTIEEYSWDGELRREIRIRALMNPVTQQEFAAAIDRIADRFLSGQGLPRRVVHEAFEGMEPPSARPTWAGLIVDDRGWLWAQLYSADVERQATWLVFDRDGRAHGSVTMPTGLTVLHIGADHVVGVWRDALEVEHVRLHRISGRP